MEWFLIRDNDHLGPFTEDVLHQLFKNGEVESDSLVWREGLEESKTYQEVFLAENTNTDHELSDETEDFKVLSEKVDTVYDATPTANVIKSEELPPDFPEDVPLSSETDLPPDLPPGLPTETSGQQEKNFKNQVQAIKEKVKPVAENAPREVKEITERKIVTQKKNITKNTKPLAVKLKKSSPPVKRTKPIKESDYEVEMDDVFKYDDDVAKQEKRLQKLLRHSIIAGITLLFCLPVFLYLTQEKIIFSRPSTMSLEDYERLAENSKSDAKDIKFAFSLASDKRTLWISANVPLEGEVFIKFKSQPHRTLGDMRVEVKSRGILEKRLITLKEFQFVQGTKFVDGYYDAEIYTVNDLEEPFLNRFFEPREKQFRFLDSVLITSLHPIEFKKELARQQAKRNSNDRKFWEELKEEYRTVKGITENIKASLEQTFNATEKEWPKAVENFEMTYKSNYGVFFTSFVQTIEAKFDKISKQDFPDKIKILSEYKRLNELAKEIGEESMTVLENLKSASIEGMSPEKYQDFKYNTLLKINLIISQCEKMIEEL